MSRPWESVQQIYSGASAHSGSQHDRSVLLEHSLLLLLKARDSETMDLEASLKRSDKWTSEDLLIAVQWQQQKAAAKIRNVIIPSNI